MLLTGVFLLFSLAVNAEYYRYTDEEGVVRFTDDMTQIPETHRESVDAFSSEASENSTMMREDTYDGDQASGADNVSGAMVEEYASPAGETFETRAAELNRLQEKLHAARQKLEKERAELEARSPAEDAPEKDKIVYRTRVDALNARIEQYGEDLKAFEEKVEAFNNRGRSDKPE